MKNKELVLQGPSLVKCKAPTQSHVGTGEGGASWMQVVDSKEKQYFSLIWSNNSESSRFISMDVLHWSQTQSLFD